MSYNPGSPRGITHIRDRIYAVDSFRTEDASYQVDLDRQTCTCKHFIEVLSGTSGTCKHIKAVEREESNHDLIQKARNLRDEQLEKLFRRYQRLGHADVCGAIKIVQQERQLRAKQDAYLKSLFS